jgi:hypothetical protein
LSDTSVVDREPTERAFFHRVLRAGGELYVMLVPAVGVFVLLTTDTGPRGTVVAVLLAPIAFGFASIAIRSLAETLAMWRKVRVRANVARELLDLGREYRLLSRSSVTPGREDHIAIGPNGIFVIVACDDAGRVTASSRRVFVNARLPWRDLVDDCRVDTLRVRERVRRAVRRPLPVHSVLCFARALVAVGQEIQGVKVVQAARLARLIASTSAPTRLSEREVEQIAVALTEAREVARPSLALLARRPRRSRSASHGDRRLALVGPMPVGHHDR